VVNIEDYWRLLEFDVENTKDYWRLLEFSVQNTKDYWRLLRILEVTDKKRDQGLTGAVIGKTPYIVESALCNC